MTFTQPQTPGVVLETISGEQLFLGPDTLLVALDDTGHESFADPQHPVFGLGGCAVLVADYERLISDPWNYMCTRFFPTLERPLHAADLRNLSEEQLDALRHFFERFQFFRVAVTISASTEKMTDVHNIELVGKCMLERIAEVGKWAEFGRLVVLVEDSERIGVQIVRSLSGRHMMRGDNRIDLELGLIPKRSGFEAIEVADFIAHTAGAQTRARISGLGVRKDFEIIFRNVADELRSSMEITKVMEKQ